VNLGGQALQPVRTAVTLGRKRVRSPSPTVPFAETKEQVPGFIIIDAADLEAAKEVWSGRICWRVVTPVESSSSRGC
jgi:hypothetical protein